MRIAIVSSALMLLAACSGGGGPVLMEVQSAPTAPVMSEAAPAASRALAALPDA
jgi:hypothetical protein